MTFGAVHNHIVQMEFLRDADCRVNIIRAVGVKMNLHFTLQGRDQSFRLHVVIRWISVFIRFGCLKVFHIAFRLRELPADQGRRAHARIRRFAFLMVNGFGVFAQRHLDGKRLFDNHIVNPCAIRLDGRHLAADRVGAAGAGHHGCNAGGSGLRKAPVHRVDGINGAELRRYGVGFLVPVVPFKRK